MNNFPRIIGLQSELKRVYSADTDVECNDVKRRRITEAMVKDMEYLSIDEDDNDMDTDVDFQMDTIEDDPSQSNETRIAKCIQKTLDNEHFNRMKELCNEDLRQTQDKIYSSQWQITLYKSIDKVKLDDLDDEEQGNH
ncbi:hypothetical protein GJ496_003768 [Pomphorhynchus laevis]|nr:hypothetical protein GJ496_003768 [Pomphorhynchus laevis]